MTKLLVNLFHEAREIARKRLSVAVVDYANVIKTKGRPTNNANAEVAEFIHSQKN